MNQAVPRMRHLFSNPGQQAIEAVMRSQPLLAFDFDGTLAPIVARPDDARVSLGVAQRLDQLAQRLPVAIVTGRSVADVSPRLGFTPHFIIGNHGAEDPDHPATSDVLDALSAPLDPVRQLIGERLVALSGSGVQLEDKCHSLALHYRLARDRERALDAIRDLVKVLPRGLKVFGGKCVVNIVAAQAPDKGDAVAHLVARTQAGSAVFIGDDINDETVFERAPPHWLTVRIGRDDPMSHARFFLDTHSEVATMLHKLITALP